MKFMLLLGLIGHIFCGASDWLLTYAPNGKVNLTDFKDYEKSSVSFRGMPRWACIFVIMCATIRSYITGLCMHLRS